MLGTTANGTMTSQEPVRQQPQPPGAHGLHSTSQSISRLRVQITWQRYRIHSIAHQALPWVPFSTGLSPLRNSTRVWKSSSPQRHRLDWCTGFPGGSAGQESTCNTGDPSSIPGLGRSLGGGHGNTLQYSCLENPHGQRSLAGYNPWDCKESDTTEQLSTAYEQGQKSAIKQKLQTWEKEERKEQMLTR